MIRDSAFPVRYRYKENGGKHTALNLGIPEIHTELTVIVDSDDILLPDGVALIEAYYEKYRCHGDIGVWSFLKTDDHGEALLEMPREEFVGSYIQDRIRSPRPGDMAEVFRTKALQEFPFPEFEGEKFLSEDVVWMPLGRTYKTVFINRPLCRCKYLADGLTRNDKKQKFASPYGAMLRGKRLMDRDCGLFARVRGAILYGCYRREKPEELPACLKLDRTGDRLLVALLTPVSGAFCRKWKKQIGRRQDHAG